MYRDSERGGIIGQLFVLFGAFVLLGFSGWVIYLCFTIPLLIMKVLIPHAILDVGNGGWGFLYYLWFLIAGFIIMSCDGLQRCIKNQR